jgi:hypothetical protein
VEPLVEKVSIHMVPSWTIKCCLRQTQKDPNFSAPTFETLYKKTWGVEPKGDFMMHIEWLRVGEMHYKKHFGLTEAILTNKSWLMLK